MGVGFVEGDAQTDLDVPAGDLNVVDELAEQVLFGVEVEVIDDAAYPVGEVVEAGAEFVVAGECGAFGAEGVLPGEDVGTAVVEVGGAALEVGEFDEAGLVEVSEAAPFCLESFEFAVEAGEFGGE